jgi:hypothetical protein
MLLEGQFWKSKEQFWKSKGIEEDFVIIRFVRPTFALAMDTTHNLRRIIYDKNLVKWPVSISLDDFLTGWEEIIEEDEILKLKLMMF